MDCFVGDCGQHGFAAAAEPGVDIHGQIQQRLLEAELGSSTTFHFANGPRTGLMRLDWCKLF